MDEFRKKILSKWDKNVIETQKNLKRLFVLYDEIAFNKQISKQVNKKNYELVFKYHPSYLSQKAVRYGGVIKDGKKVYLTLSKWAIIRVVYGNGDKNSKLLGILKIFEHQLIHLMILLWEPLTKLGNKHGKLFNCAIRSFFGTDIYESFNKGAPKPNIKSEYKYDSFSCWADSLTMSLLVMNSNIFRKVFYTTNLDLVDYTENGKFVNPCDEEYSVEEFRVLGSAIQRQLIYEYNSMIKNEDNLECSRLRSLIHRCYGDIKDEDDEWEMYNVSEYYSLLASIFPSLMFNDIPRVIISKYSPPRSSIERGNKAMFTFWEFMDPITLDKDDPNARAPMYIWDEFPNHYDFIVFRNGGFPTIKKFGDDKPEKIKVTSYKVEDGEYFEVKEKRVINKRTCFGETIINGKYEMMTAVMLHGVRPGESGGKHYTAYINTLKGWVHYDDMEGMKEFSEFPSQDILYEKRGTKPEMYIYALKK